jgi:hypothetical protein
LDRYVDQYGFTFKLALELKATSGDYPDNATFRSPHTVLNKGTTRGIKPEVLPAGFQNIFLQ